MDSASARSANDVAVVVAERTASAVAASRTVIDVPAGRPSLAGGREAASAETVNGLSRFSRPLSTASNSRYSVISLVSEAG